MISGKIAKDLLPSLLQGAANTKGVRQLVTEQGMTMVTDKAQIAEMVEQVRCGVVGARQLVMEQGMTMVTDEAQMAEMVEQTLLL